MEWNCVRLYFKWFVTLSIFVLFLLSDTTNSIKRRFSKEIENEADPYKRRLNQVQDVCRQYGLAMESDGESHKEEGIDYRRIHTEYIGKVPDKYSIMHLKKYSLVYCWIHKAASSSWNKIFFEKSNIKMRDENLHMAAEKFRPQKSENLGALLNSSFSFTFVRHPFDRLVSAYRDKFELGKKTDWCYKMYAADLLNISTKGFVKKDTAYMGYVYAKVKDIQRPTFSQFVAYLLRTPVLDYNDHWLPYWLHCQFCRNKYNVIGTFESIKEDVEYIALESKLDVNITSFPWTNKKNHLPESSLEPLSVKYFRQIDRDSVLKLYNIYKIDFEMFGYSVQDYLTKER